MTEKWTFLLNIYTFYLFTYRCSTAFLYLLIFVFIYLFIYLSRLKNSVKKRKISQDVIRENIMWKACRSYIERFNYMLGIKDITFGTVHCPRCT